MDILLEGYNGNVKVENNVVIITHKKMFGIGVKGSGEKRILIKNIGSVELGKEPSFWAGRSYIRLATASDSEVQSGYHFNRTAELLEDPNTVLLSDKAQYEIAKQIRDYIENFTDNSQHGSSVSNADELIKFKNLLDSGIITQEEFEAKKKQLIGL